MSSIGLEVQKKAAVLSRTTVRRFMIPYKLSAGNLFEEQKISGILDLLFRFDFVFVFVQLVFCEHLLVYVICIYFFSECIDTETPGKCDLPNSTTYIILSKHTCIILFH